MIGYDGKPYEGPNIQTRWAFDIHKDADALLHTRLQGFMAFNALLTAGFFLTVRDVSKQPELRILALLTCLVGLLVSLLFRIGMRRVVDGVIRLKEAYLFADPVYLTYYGKQNVTKAGRAKHGYRFAKGALAVFISFWLAATAYALDAWRCLPFFQ